MTKTLSRRAFLSRSAVLGCSLAASPLLTPVSFAAAPWDTRLIVIILRGGMDGLDVVQPYGDPDFAAARSALPGGPANGAHDLDGFFALHPKLAPLMPLWRKQELGFVHAVSTPYRDKRSHFDGQDLLEAGTVSMNGVHDGWLNRMLQVTKGVETTTAYAIGNEDMNLLAGAAPVSNWSPDVDLVLSPQARRLAAMIMQDDPTMNAALQEALTLVDRGALEKELAQLDEPDTMDGDMQMTPADPMVQGNTAGHIRIAQFAAQQLRNDARIAAFSLNGWDTHFRQTANLGRALTRLSETILALHTELSAPIWQKTAILVMTEFGRTVRINGTSGTDHGTGGAMIYAGGALRGGRVLGDWPGLSEADQYQRRDLMPTGDVRAIAAWAMRGLTGLDQTALETTVFPGLSMGDNPRLL